MQEVHKRVAAVTPVTLGDETTAALLIGATTIPLANSGDFYEAGGQVLIAGNVYAYSTVEEGEDDDTPEPSITLDTGLLADLPEGSIVEEWDPSADGGAGAVAVDYMVDVTDDVDGSPGQAYLHYTLIPMLPEGLPPGVGDSVVVRIDDDDDWWVVNVIGRRATVGFDHVRTGTLDVGTVLTVGTEDAQRVVIDGSPVIKAYDATNEQTVNIDGVQNFMQGSTATDAPGNPRVEVGQGSAFLSDAQEVRYYTEDAREEAPAALSAATEGGAGSLTILSPAFDDPDAAALLQLRSGGAYSSNAFLQAALVVLAANDLAFDANDPTITLDSAANRVTIVGELVAPGFARSFSGTTGTAAGTAAKTATISGYTPAAGDTLALTLTNGNTVASPTLNINSGGAKSILLGGAAVGTVFGSSAAGAVWGLRYDGTSWHLTGAQQANTNLVAIASLSPSNDDILQRKAGAWTNRTIAQLKTDLALAIADVTNLQSSLDALKPVTGGNAAFNSAANAVNTTGKYEGRPGYNTVADRPIWATGANTTDVWVYADGTTAHTPV